MLSGKAVQLAIRGHMLVHNVLTVLHLEEALLCSTDGNNNTACLEDTIVMEQNSEEYRCSDNYIQNDDMQILAVAFDNLEKGIQSVNEVITNQSLQNVVLLCEQGKVKMSTNRAACLWYQYMDMVSLLQRFIQAERTDNWSLHLESKQKMLPFFASSIPEKHLYRFAKHVVFTGDTSRSVQCYQS